MVESSTVLRLRGVATREELHAFLNALSEKRGNRWTRTQVLHYLRPELHAAAEGYFDAEKLVGVSLPPFTADETVLLTIDEAIREVESHLGEASSTPNSIVDETLGGGKLSCDPPRSTSDRVGNALAALKEEIDELNRTKTKRYRLSGGRCIAADGMRYRYVFRWSSDPEPFVPGVLWIGQQPVQARVGNQGDGEKAYELLLDRFVGKSVENGTFTMDPSFVARVSFELLNGARDRIEAGIPLVEALFRKPDSQMGSIDDSDHGGRLNQRQREALIVAGDAQRSYVWGPPGTGKTTTLGATIRMRVEAGARVLMVSPYNVAVDEGMLSAERQGGWSPGDLVRVGRVSPAVRHAGLDLDSHLERVAEHTGLLLHTQRFHRAVFCRVDRETAAVPKSVRACIEDVGALIIAAADFGLGDLREELLRTTARIRERFREPVDRIIGDARVVGTTVALSQLSPVIHEGYFDHVVVDEASVLRLPDSILLATRQPKRLTFFGDPKQLTTITASDTRLTRKWLKPNPFAMASIKRPADAGGTCVFLDEQHRMAPNIRKIVSNLFYDGELTDGENPRDGRLAWYDTSRTSARATAALTGLSYSRENLVHRGVVTRLLRDLDATRPGASKLVLTPFRAQKAAYVREANTNRISGVRFGTIHASQGTESEIVIVDLVVAPGRGRPRFLLETKNRELPNLLNVGLSRAKTDLIIVGHADHIREMYGGWLLHRLMELVAEAGAWYAVPPDLRLPRLPALFVAGGPRNLSALVDLSNAE